MESRYDIQWLGLERTPQEVFIGDGFISVPQTIWSKYGLSCLDPIEYRMYLNGYSIQLNIF